MGFCRFPRNNWQNRLKKIDAPLYLHFVTNLTKIHQTLLLELKNTKCMILCFCMNAFNLHTLGFMFHLVFIWTSISRMSAANYVSITSFSYPHFNVIIRFIFGSQKMPSLLSATCFMALEDDTNFGTFIYLICNIAINSFIPSALHSFVSYHLNNTINKIVVDFLC